jgi:ribosomal protein S18 acetylase RimI-like enzyme
MNLPQSDSIIIKEAMPNEFNIIQDIAHKTWPVTYGDILSNIQLSYMLELFYSLETLNKNVSNAQEFLIAWKADTPIGFASFEHNYNRDGNTHIHKIYILPEMQGTGAGKRLMEAIELEAKKGNSTSLTLNVNRSNSARDFYKKIGFEIIQEVDIELDHGYLMEDYVMQKSLAS